MIQSLVPLEFLRIDVLRLEYEVDGTGALMAFNPNAQVQKDKLPRAIRLAVDEIETLREQRAVGLMVNILPPKLVVPVHVDPEPHGRNERWHLPIVTNPKADWWSRDGVQHMEAGWWYGPMKFWEPHQVWNHGPEARCHLIVDLVVDALPH